MRSSKRSAITIATSLATIGAALFWSTSAWADKVAILKFHGSGLTTDQLIAARQATHDAVASKGHTFPSDTQMLEAEASVTDGTADVSSEYETAGKVAKADWTLVGTADSDPSGGYHLELVACQISTGRVESAARDTDVSTAKEDILEMVVFLLRPQGIGSETPPWLGKKRTPKPPPPQPVKPPEPPPPPPPPKPPEPPPPPPKAYAEGHPIAAGLGLGVSNALKRPAMAYGPTWSMVFDIYAGYAIDAVPGLEARANLGITVIGPSAFTLDGGAKYALPIAALARYHLFIGPEVGLGIFATEGAKKEGYFLIHGSAFASWQPHPMFQLDAVGDLSPALGADTFILGGGTLRAMVRF